MDETDKPPPSICKSTSIRVHSSSNDRRFIRRREMAFIQHLPSPMLASRFRNDLVVLETV